VVREKVGGLNGDKLQASDQLTCKAHTLSQHYRLADEDQPQYNDGAILRVVLGYQQVAFDIIEKQRFFSSRYQVTDRSDRMGFRLEGQAIKSDIVGMLSEGICHGAIQIPADGQPIVLMNDRQTIGGYPKIGSVIPLDTAKLAQLSPEASIQFEAIGPEYAHNLHCLAKSRFERTQPLQCN
jgi:allophanate hydrolase subunit 2